MSGRALPRRPWLLPALVVGLGLWLSACSDSRPVADGSDPEPTAEVAPIPVGDDSRTGIVLADEPPSEDAATPSPVDDDLDGSGVVEADGGTGEPLALDSGSALACAALEIGRDAAADGDTARAVALAGRIDGASIGDRAIRDITTELIGSGRADRELLDNGVTRCQALGYETGS